MAFLRKLMNKLYAFILALMLCATFYSVSPGEINPNSLPAQVHEFVQGIMGEFKDGYWVANQQVAHERTLMIDITIIIQEESARFVLTLIDGKIVNVTNVSVDADVDCQEEYRGFIDGA
jgi:hypothetical protein